MMYGIKPSKSLLLHHAVTVTLTLSAPLAADEGDDPPVQIEAAGFATEDLSPLGPVLAEVMGSDYLVQADPARVTLACTTCAGAPIVDVLLGAQTD